MCWPILGPLTMCCVAISYEILARSIGNLQSGALSAFGNGSVRTGHRERGAEVVGELARQEQDFVNS